MILVLALTGIVLFVFGLTFIYKGYRTTPDAAQVVSKKKFQKLEDQWQASVEKENDLKKQLDTLAVDLEKSREKLEELEKTREMIESLRQTEQKYTNTIHELEQNMVFLSGKADTQAFEAAAVIEQLDAENKRLRKEVQQKAEAVSAEDYEGIQGQNKDLQDQITRHSRNVEDLQRELTEKEQKAREEIRDAQNRIQVLSNENIKLKSGLEALREKIEEVWTVSDQALQKNRGHLQKTEKLIARLQEESHVLREKQSGVSVENNDIREDLQRQLAESLRTNQQLKEGIAALKEQIQANEKTINQLETENERLRKTADSVVKEASATTREGWGQKRSQLDHQLKMLRDFNSRLIEKEKLLEFELSKSRAQATGLEKLCAGMGMN